MNVMVKEAGPRHISALSEKEFSAVEKALSENFPGNIGRVLLINPPDGTRDLFQYDTAKRGRYTNYPPYGLGVLAAKLRSMGIEVEICNLNHTILSACRQTSAEADFDFDSCWQKPMDEVVCEFKPDLIGVTCMFTMGHGLFRDVCRRAKEAGVTVVAGGVHVSNDTHRILDDVGAGVIDAAFTGEADETFPAFLKVVNRDEPVHSLSGVTMATHLGPIGLGGAQVPDVQELNTVPALDLLDIEELSDQGVIGAFYCFKPKGTRFATVLSNRGCRGKCSFCSVRNFNGPGVRHRSVSSVVDELTALHDNYGVGHIMWLDDDLFKDHRRAVELFSELAKRNLDLTWDATNGVLAASCTDEVVAAAAESGCIAINIGVESGNPDILRKVSKPATVDIYRRAATVLNKYPQIHTSVFLMIGFPGETLGQIQDTISLAEDMNMDWYRISQLHPLPNTPIYDSMVAQGLLLDVGSTGVRFNGGAFGKQTSIEAGAVKMEQGLADAFRDLSPEMIPSPELLTDIWFYMNYRLNFSRIFAEDRPEKLDQLRAHLVTLADLISPENGFALYFLAWLYRELDPDLSCDYIGRLKQRLETSEYWRDKFEVFGLSADSLEAGQGRVVFTQELLATA
jgi:radical SAM superfamily enzyme YgiQ (UPF0313 family)